MFVPSSETNRKYEEKHETVSLQEDAVKATAGEHSQKSLPKEKQEAEDANEGKKNECTSSYSRQCLRRKLDTGEDVHNSGTPSDLSSGSSRKKKFPPNDKVYIGNSLAVMKHYNSLIDTGFKSRLLSRIVYMRNFNNWIKTMVINEFLGRVKQDKLYGSPVKVLDMCCGKGGDLMKWEKQNITYLICADIANVSVECCQQRYNELVNKRKNKGGYSQLYKIECIVADCTKVLLREKFKDPSIQLDFVSCQFAFHYSFESLQQAECMLRNASETLRPGGYFIGTIPDAYDLVSRWQKCGSNKFGNDIYSIEFLCDRKTPPPLFGAKYNFQLEEVVNCPEYLVHFPTFCKLASKFGFELVLFERFDNYYERMKNEGKLLLKKIQALELYPPFHNVPLVGDPERDYQHAERYMQDLPGHRKIGTLSQTEWEVISLYAVFAFRKLKSVWNDGKVEYVRS